MISWVPKKPIDRKFVEDALCKCEETNQFTNGGPNVKKLELTIRERLGIDEHKCVVCVCNGSAAIQVLCGGIEYKCDKPIKWATQSFTFPPSAQSTLKGTVIVDIDEEGGLDLKQVPEDIGGIIVTNVFGNVVNIEKYEEWAKENHKLLVFDNAATSYTTYKGKNSCNYGHGSIISFHHTKPLGFGEGGAIIVDKIYEKSIRRFINFGLDNECYNIKWHPNASNYKMSDISAIYILQHLTRMDKIIDHHKLLYAHLSEKLDNIRLYPSFGDDIPFVSCFCLLFDEYNDEICEQLLSNGVYCRKYYKPLEPTPIAIDLYNKILCIPCTCEVTVRDLDMILEIIQ